MTTSFSDNNSMKKQKKIYLISYDPKWPLIFKKEAELIQTLLGNDLNEIHHIGSTAIPNMTAKPVIDILLVCDNLDNISLIAEKLISLNYEPLRRQIIPHYSFFTRKEREEISFHLHLHERGSLQIQRHINFRDYVIHHPDVASRYAKLKIQLAEKFFDDIYSYVTGKDKLVQEIDAKAKLWIERRKNYLSPQTGQLAKNWSHDKIIKAMEANLNVQMTHFAQYINSVELVRIPGFTLVNTSLPDDTFNYVLDADFSDDQSDIKILEITDYFRKKSVPFSWWVSPNDNPKNLSDHLKNYGYQNTENNIAMYFDLDTWDDEFSITPDLNIIRAVDEKTLHDFALVLTNDAASFKTYFSWIASVLTIDDPIEYYVGYVNGKPVVRGLFCYFAQVAGLYWLSTALDERRKGYVMALQYHCLKRAKELGFHVSVLQASPKDYPVYQKLGYQKCGVFREFKLDN